MDTDYTSKVEISISIPTHIQSHIHTTSSFFVPSIYKLHCK